MAQQNGTSLIQYLPHVSDKAVLSLTSEQQAMLSDIECQHLEQSHRAFLCYSAEFSDVHRQYLKSLATLGLSEKDLVETTPEEHHEAT